MTTQNNGFQLVLWSKFLQSFGLSMTVGLIYREKDSIKKDLDFLQQFSLDLLINLFSGIWSIRKFNSKISIEISREKQNFFKANRF